MTKVDELVKFVQSQDASSGKAKIALATAKRFDLTKDRSVYYCKEFAIRFSSSANSNFGNTVLSLSSLHKYDDRPFIVILVLPSKIDFLLANTTLLKKISHSSHELRINNIKGSFNGSDIMRELSSITNTAENLQKLFNVHEGFDFEDNLRRLVDATHNIVPTGKHFNPTLKQIENILEAPKRAKKFVRSSEYVELKNELDAKVKQFKNEIMLAALIDNVNVRGRVIEYLIAGEDAALIHEIVLALQEKRNGIPPFRTENSLGDVVRSFRDYETATDVKTKIMVLNSNPKAYNLDKMLIFLSDPKSVFLFYFVGIDTVKIADTVLISMFNESLINATIKLKHWAGRNSRGVTQFVGEDIHNLIRNPHSHIDIQSSKEFLQDIIAT